MFPLLLASLLLWLPWCCRRFCCVFVPAVAGVYDVFKVLGVVGVFSVASIPADPGL